MNMDKIWMHFDYFLVICTMKAETFPGYFCMREYTLFDQDNTLLKKIKGTWSAPSLVCGHSQVQLLEDMHNCTSLKSLMFKKTINFTCNEFDTTLAPL